MSHNSLRLIITALAAMPAFMIAATPLFAQDSGWRVNKVSGDIWVTSSGVQQASLATNAMLKPGDGIRTGRNGRVLLIRGTETILIAANSEIIIPQQTNAVLSTTIIQRSGSILLDVEKRNQPHFEVETPYLAAVVKGTQFRVTIADDDAAVDVLSGKVEVTDFKSGQFAMTLPGQTAKVSLQGLAGLSLTGSGTFNPIQYGNPRTPSAMPWPTSPGRAPTSTSSVIAQNVRPKQQWNDDTPPTALPGQPIRARTQESRSHAGSNDPTPDILDAAKDLGQGNNARGGQDENIMTYLTVPPLIGLLVSLGIAIKRRRNRGKR
jgi:hypothetical protein